MVRAGDLIGVVLLIGLGVGPAGAAQPASRASVDRLQGLERAVAQAIEAGDGAALRRLATAVTDVGASLPEDEDRSVVAPCRMAAGLLWNLIDDVTALPPLRSRIAFARDWRRYVESMGPCERAVGLGAPAGVSLR